MLKKFYQYYHTVKYLKLSQILYRIYYRIAQKKSIKKLDYIGDINRDWASWVEPIIFTKCFRDGQKFTFIGQSHHFENITWIESSKSKLWNYNLNYFEFLFCRNNAHDPQSNIDLIYSWIEKAPKTVAYDPYPISLRTVNWIKFIIYYRINDKNINSSIYTQVNFLYDVIEYHLLGNHILENCKALIFAGVYFNDSRSVRWLAKGLKLLKREIGEQINSDGSHFELSPMYHAIVFELLLDVLNILNNCKNTTSLVDSVKKSITEKIPAMYHWLESTTHLDGTYAHFNDSTDKVAATLDEIHKYCVRLGFNVYKSREKIRIYKDSGIVVVNNWNYRLLIDAGPVGASYQPGHAHANSLSFELSLEGEKIIGNSGISTYESNDRRLFERSTLAHSTVTINNQSSSEVWGSFRVARRAAVRSIHKKITSDKVGLVFSHDGFKKIYGYGIHRREFIITENKITIIDSVDSRSPLSIGRIIIHPNTKIEDHDNIISLITPQGSRLTISSSTQLQVSSSLYALGFNNLAETYIIEYQLTEETPAHITIEMLH